MEIYWTPEAIKDRIEIYEYVVEEGNSVAALTISDLFSEQAAQACVAGTACK